MLEVSVSYKVSIWCCSLHRVPLNTIPLPTLGQNGNALLYALETTSFYFLSSAFVSSVILSLGFISDALPASFGFCRFLSVRSVVLKS